MKQVRSVALSRQHAPTFTPLTEDEGKTLRQLPAWMRWTFWELVGMSDFRTGRITCSYARLAALLDFDKPPTGRPPAGAVTLKQIRGAIDQLQALGLVLREKGRNERDGVLRLLVSPRKGFATPNAELGRGSGRGATPRKAKNGAGSRPAEDAVSAGVRAGGSAMNSFSPTPQASKLPTGARHVGELLGPPRGPELSPAAPGTPPLRPLPLEDRARLHAGRTPEGPFCPWSKDSRADIAAKSGPSRFVLDARAKLRAKRDDG